PRPNTSPHAPPTATTPPSPQRTSLNHSYRQASPQFGSASPTSSHDPASADTPHARRVRELRTPSPGIIQHTNWRDEMTCRAQYDRSPLVGGPRSAGPVEAALSRRPLRGSLP